MSYDVDRAKRSLKERDVMGYAGTNEWYIHHLMVKNADLEQRIKRLEKLFLGEGQ